jgi:hypothetical protein
MPSGAGSAPEAAMGFRTVHSRIHANTLMIGRVARSRSSAGGAARVIVGAGGG